MPNRLAQETSPYLLQHADNPVDWQPWGAEAFARARAENKPVLLSVGYAACHWCHVMAHESFEDPAVAAVMNELFVSIKVDREERPDVDTLYQSALALLGQQGGWPLTMFLTADGEPFWGGTYFPPTNRWGRPGFTDVLRALADTYATEPEKVTGNVTALAEALAKQSENRAGAGLDRDVLDEVAERMAGQIDPVWGGLRGAPKFPQPGILELLWRGWRRTRHAGSGRTPWRDAVLRTLTAMSQGGIYDHLGGGFARYSTDEEWLAPHFEKMLYDNAQLVGLLTLAWQENRDPLYAARVAETVAWIEREMIAEGGAFAATLDADSEGEEGRFYVWSEAEIDAALGDRSAVFKHTYDVSAHGNWEEKNILNRRHHPALGDDTAEAALAADRAVLLDLRGARVRPGWDDKVLADWNGLMIAALARAAQAFDRPDWIALAETAFAAVVRQLGDGDRLAHAWRRGRATAPGLLDDYADMAAAALALHEATEHAAYLEDARRWTAVLDSHFWDDSRGGYFMTADDGEALIVRTKSVYDAAVPAGNGTMLGVLARLHLLTGDRRYSQRAEALVTAFAGELQRNFIPLATWLNHAEDWMEPLQVVVIGPRDDPATVALLRAVHRRSLPGRLLLRLDPGAALPEGHPAAGKTMLDGRPTAYLCRGPVCQAPVTTPEALLELIGS
ncbi:MULTISPECIES: thioredoxin domain-containing protein [unclassified Inquilinus]|uniref:thioredoxin domain-containing protein n=1 Tax=unclassified Inquilinus TaxID=2645927 RepID=UPI003F92FE0B